MPVAFAGIFFGLSGWFGQFFGGKAAVTSAAIVLLSALVAVMYATCTTALAAIRVAVPSELDLALGLLPANTSTCLTALFTVAVVRWVVDGHAKVAAMGMAA